LATCTSANADDGGFLTQHITGEDDDLSLLSVLTFPVLLPFVFSVLTVPDLWVGETGHQQMEHPLFLWAE
jgi:hypothetical protein